MTIGQRIKRFAEHVYGSQRKFAEAANISESTVSKYIKDRITPNIETLIVFQKSGLSIDWLLSGNGQMLIKSHKVQSDKDSEGNLRDVLPHEKLRMFIMDNFNSLENFALLMNMNLRTLENFLDNNLIPDMNFMNKLRMCGCSINWLINDEGDEYADNYIGTILRNRNKKKTDFTPEEKLDLRKINDLTTIEFYDFIKFAIREEKNKSKGGDHDK